MDYYWYRRLYARQTHRQMIMFFHFLAAAGLLSIAGMAIDLAVARWKGNKKP